MSSAPRKIGILYTGGTIGMTTDLSDPVQLPEFEKLLTELRGVQKHRRWFHYDWSPKEPATLFDFVAGWPGAPIDSSEMSPMHWVAMATAIRHAFKSNGYDGIVVIHGTDTLAWTASALSFLLGELSSPVVVTGSQSPLGQPRTDGVRNLLTALEFAAKPFVHPQVCVCFDQSLLQGNRSTKVEINGYDGFHSPNVEPIGTVGAHFVLRQARKRRMNGIEPSDASPYSWPIIHTVRLQPGVDARTLPSVDSLDSTPFGVILETYGSGTAPKKALREWLVRCREAGGIVVARSQLPRGSVTFGYLAGSWLRDEDVQVLPGFDITNEALYAKLLLLLAANESRERVDSLLGEDLCGEVTVPPVETTSSKEASLPRSNQLPARAIHDMTSMLRTIRSVVQRRFPGAQFISNQKVDLLVLLDDSPSIAFEILLRAGTTSDVRRLAETAKCAEAGRVVLVFTTSPSAAARSEAVRLGVYLLQYDSMLREPSWLGAVLDELPRT